MTRGQNEKLCGACRQPFTSRDVRQLYCDLCRSLKRNANRTRREQRESHHLSFVGIDGEGVDRPDGSHEYVMLSVGEQTLFRGGEKLDLREILSFLWQCYRQEPNSAYIGFFLGYDFTQWFSQLPQRQAYLLFTNKGILERKSERKSHASVLPDPVVWQGWDLDVMAGRRFKLRPHVHRRSLFNDACRNRTCDFDFQTSDAKALITASPTPVDRSPSQGWFYLCDTGSFWQTSFLNVIKPTEWHGQPVCTSDEYALIARGKEARGEVYGCGDVSYFGDMSMYNVLENALLARVTTRLNQGFMNDEIPIRLKRHEWFGPGRAAQVWMDTIHTRISNKHAVSLNRKSPERRVNEYGIRNADVYMSVPSWFIKASQESYYGGWFEIAMHGHVGTVYEYDVNSAYPYIISSLPCLHTDQGHNGVYSRGAGTDFPRGERQYTLLYGTFTGSDRYLGALPFRTRTGNILRPHRVKGWYWAHEVDAAQKAGLVSSYTVEEWVSYRACDCSSPFNADDIGIRRMYNLRLQMGKNTAAGKAFKLVYNSAYGKTAQSIGTPKYANPVYASLITSGCRTLILEAIASHPLGSSGVAMVATDGVYFLERHPSLSLSPNLLGAWDETIKEGMTLLMPGVYWDDKARQAIASGETVKMKSRGVSSRDLASQIDRLDYEFAAQYERLMRGQEYVWPEIQFPIKFQMVSTKLALHRNAWNTAGKVIHDSIRALSANPESKRIPDPYIDIESGILRTSVYPMWSTESTTPYHRSFGYLNGDLDRMEDVLGRDGRDTLADVRDALTG